MPYLYRVPWEQIYVDEESQPAGSSLHIDATEAALYCAEHAKNLQSLALDKGVGAPESGEPQLSFNTFARPSLGGGEFIYVPPDLYEAVRQERSRRVH